MSAYFYIGPVVIFYNGVALNLIGSNTIEIDEELKNARVAELISQGQADKGPRELGHTRAMFESNYVEILEEYKDRDEDYSLLGIEGVRKPLVSKSCKSLQHQKYILIK